MLSLEEEDGEIIESENEAEKEKFAEPEKSVEKTMETQVEELKNLGDEENQVKETQITKSQEGGEIVELINTKDNGKAMETPNEGGSHKVVNMGTKGRDSASLRPSLPRSSKDNHSVLSNSAVQKAKDASRFLNKKSIKKNH